MGRTDGTQVLLEDTDDGEIEEEAVSDNLDKEANNDTVHAGTGSRRKEIKSLVWEVVFYAFFLTLLVTTAIHNRDQRAYQLSALTLNQLNPDDKFDKISTPEKMFEWIEKHLVPYLHGKHGWHHHDNPDLYGYNTIGSLVSVRFSPTRIRQHRMRREPCRPPSKLNYPGFDLPCIPEWSSRDHDWADYTQGWNGKLEPCWVPGNPWAYKTWSDIGGTPILGRLGVYPPGGYLVDLDDLDTSPAVEALGCLQKANWVDEWTKVVIAEATIYNADSGLFALITALFEFPQANVIQPKLYMHPFKLFANVGNNFLTTKLFDLLIVFAIAWFALRLYVKLKRARLAFFLKFWTVVELVNLLAAIAACVLYFGRQLVAENLADRVTEMVALNKAKDRNPDRLTSLRSAGDAHNSENSVGQEYDSQAYSAVPDYVLGQEFSFQASYEVLNDSTASLQDEPVPDIVAATEATTESVTADYTFQTLAMWDQVGGILLGFTCCLSTLQVLHLCRFNRRLSLLGATMSRAASDLAAFTVMFVLVMASFVSFSFMMFGPWLYMYSTVIGTIQSLILVALGDMQYEKLESASRIFAPVFVFLYVGFIVFLLLNMLVSILVDSFTIAREAIQDQANDFELIDYITNRTSMVLTALMPCLSSLMRKGGLAVPVQPDSDRISLLAEEHFKGLSKKRRDTVAKSVCYSLLTETAMRNLSQRVDLLDSRLNDLWSVFAGPEWDLSLQIDSLYVPVDQERTISGVVTKHRSSKDGAVTSMDNRRDLCREANDKRLAIQRKTCYDRDFENSDVFLEEDSRTERRRRRSFSRTISSGLTHAELVNELEYNYKNGPKPLEKLFQHYKTGTRSTSIPDTPHSPEEIYGSKSRLISSASTSSRRSTLDMLDVIIEPATPDDQFVPETKPRLKFHFSQELSDVTQATSDTSFGFSPSDDDMPVRTPEDQQVPSLASLGLPMRSSSLKHQTYLVSPKYRQLPDSAGKTAIVPRISPPFSSPHRNRGSFYHTAQMPTLKDQTSLNLTQPVHFTFVATPKKPQQPTSPRPGVTIITPIRRKYSTSTPRSLQYPVSAPLGHISPSGNLEEHGSQKDVSSYSSHSHPILKVESNATSSSHLDEVMPPSAKSKPCLGVHGSPHTPRLIGKKSLKFGAPSQTQMIVSTLNVSKQQFSLLTPPLPFPHKRPQYVPTVGTPRLYSNTEKIVTPGKKSSHSESSLSAVFLDELKLKIIKRSVSPESQHFESHALPYETNALKPSLELQPRKSSLKSRTEQLFGPRKIKSVSFADATCETSDSKEFKHSVKTSTFIPSVPSKDMSDDSHVFKKPHLQPRKLASSLSLCDGSSGKVTTELGSVSHNKFYESQTREKSALQGFDGQGSVSALIAYHEKSISGISNKDRSRSLSIKRLLSTDGDDKEPICQPHESLLKDDRLSISTIDGSFRQQLSQLVARQSMHIESTPQSLQTKKRFEITQGASKTETSRIAGKEAISTSHKMSFSEPETYASTSVLGSRFELLDQSDITGPAKEKNIRTSSFQGEDSLWNVERLSVTNIDESFRQHLSELVARQSKQIESTPKTVRGTSMRNIPKDHESYREISRGIDKDTSKYSVAGTGSQAIPESNLVLKQSNKLEHKEADRMRGRSQCSDLSTDDQNVSVTNIDESFVKHLSELVAEQSMRIESSSQRFENVSMNKREGSQDLVYDEVSSKAIHRTDVNNTLNIRPIYKNKDSLLENECKNPENFNIRGSPKTRCESPDKGNYSSYASSSHKASSVRRETPIKNKAGASSAQTSMFHFKIPEIVITTDTSDENLTGGDGPQCHLVLPQISDEKPDYKKPDLNLSQTLSSTDDKTSLPCPETVPKQIRSASLVFAEPRKFSASQIPLSESCEANASRSFRPRSERVSSLFELLDETSARRGSRSKPRLGSRRSDASLIGAMAVAPSLSKSRLSKSRESINESCNKPL